MCMYIYVISLSLSHTHTHIHIHTHSHPRTHTHIHTHKHLHTHTYTHIHTQTLQHTHIHARTRIRTRTRTLTRSHEYPVSPPSSLRPALSLSHTHTHSISRWALFIRATMRHLGLLALVVAACIRVLGCSHTGMLALTEHSGGACAARQCQQSIAVGGGGVAHLVLALRGGGPKKAAGKRAKPSSPAAPVTSGTASAGVAEVADDVNEFDAEAGTMPSFPPGSLPEWAHEIAEWRNMTMKQRVVKIGQRHAEANFSMKEHYGEGFTSSTSEPTISDPEAITSTRSTNDVASSLSGDFGISDSSNDGDTVLLSSNTSKPAARNAFAAFQPAALPSNSSATASSSRNAALTPPTLPSNTQQSPTYTEKIPKHTYESAYTSKTSTATSSNAAFTPATTVAEAEAMYAAIPIPGENIGTAGAADTQTHEQGQEQDSSRDDACIDEHYHTTVAPGEVADTLLLKHKVRGMQRIRMHADVMRKGSRCGVLWSGAVCCGVLRCVAVCCSVLQCVAVF